VAGHTLRIACRDTPGPRPLRSEWTQA
jgi:hypothetical protein